MNWLDNLNFQFRGIYRERGNSRICSFPFDEPRIHLTKSKTATPAEEEPVENIEDQTELISDAETVPSPEIVAKNRKMRNPKRTDPVH
jgi:hypothetical protein